MLRLLSIATNYEGTTYELPDCQLDGARVLDAFKPYCESAVGLFGRKATRDGITKAVHKLIGSLKEGDLGILYFSGHGTYETIKGKRVEAIVCHGGSVIYDFEKRDVFNKRAAGSLIVAASDSCYSGGMLRTFGREPRTVSIDRLRTHKVDMPTRTPDRPNGEFSASSVKEVAYSTGNGGAWTNAMLAAFEERGIKTTLPALHQRIRRALPNSEWPQTPQFAADKTLAKRTLKSFVGAG